MSKYQRGFITGAELDEAVNEALNDGHIVILAPEGMDGAQALAHIVTKLNGGDTNGVRVVLFAAPNDAAYAGGHVH